MSFDNCSICNHHHKQDLDYFHHPRNSLEVLSTQSPPNPRGNHCSNLYLKVIGFACSFCLLSLDILFLSDLCCWIFKAFVPFYCWGAFHCIIPQLIHPFSSWWTFEWFPVWGYYEQSCCKHFCTRLFLWTYYVSSWVHI